MQHQKISVDIRSTHLTDAQKEEMWNVYKRYYSSSKDSFFLRIPRHNHFSLELVAGKIIGFTGLPTKSPEIEERKPSHSFLYTPELA